MLPAKISNKTKEHDLQNHAIKVSPISAIFSNVSSTSTAVSHSQAEVGATEQPLLKLEYAANFLDRSCPDHILSSGSERDWSARPDQLLLYSPGTQICY